MRVALSHMVGFGAFFSLYGVAVAQESMFGIPEFDESDFVVQQLFDDETALIESAGVQFVCRFEDGAAHLSVGRCLPIVGVTQSKEIEAAIDKADADAFALEIEERATAERARVALAIGEGRARIPTPANPEELVALEPSVFDGVVKNAFVLNGCSVDVPFDLFPTGPSQGLFLANLGVEGVELLPAASGLYTKISESFDRLFLSGELTLRDSNSIAELKDCK
jgi:hypothetical protein